MTDALQILFWVLGSMTIGYWVVRGYWRAKWGQEVHTDVFGTRLAWALGYFSEPSYFVPSGEITGAKDLTRMAGHGTTTRLWAHPS